MESPFSVEMNDASLFPSHTAFAFERLTVQMLYKIVVSRKCAPCPFLTQFQFLNNYPSPLSAAQSNENKMATKIIAVIVPSRTLFSIYLQAAMEQLISL
jgi:hypothetical protein